MFCSVTVPRASPRPSVPTKVCCLWTQPSEMLTSPSWQPGLGPMTWRRFLHLWATASVTFSAWRTGEVSCFDTNEMYFLASWLSSKMTTKVSPSWWPSKVLNPACICCLFSSLVSLTGNYTSLFSCRNGFFENQLLFESSSLPWWNMFRACLLVMEEVEIKAWGVKLYQHKCVHRVQAAAKLSALIECEVQLFWVISKWSYFCQIKKTPEWKCLMCVYNQILRGCVFVFECFEWITKTNMTKQSFLFEADSLLEDNLKKQTEDNFLWSQSSLLGLSFFGFRLTSYLKQHIWLLWEKIQIWTICRVLCIWIDEKVKTEVE